MIDAETKQVLTDGEELYNMTLSKGWGICLQRIQEKILDLQMIGNVEGATPEAKIMDMEARKKAVTVLWSFLNDITGSIDQHRKAVDAMTDPVTETHIERV